jgi:hypothetical protein
MLGARNAEKTRRSRSADEKKLKSSTSAKTKESTKRKRSTNVGRLKIGIAAVDRLRN